MLLEELQEILIEHYVSPIPVPTLSLQCKNNVGKHSHLASVKG